MQAFMLALLVLATTMAWMRQADGQMFKAYDLILQYNECQNLTMYFNNYYYVRNDSIANNTLSEARYQRLLGKMTIDQGLAYFKKIFLVTKSPCKTFICNCTSLGWKGQVLEDYSLFFRNDSNFNGVKSIVQAFNTKYKRYLRSVPDVLSIFNIYSWNPFPLYQSGNITQFLMTNDFTRDKFLYYNIKPSVCDFTFNNSLWLVLSLFLKQLIDQN